MLEYIITSKAKRSLLKLFLTNPERAFYTRQVAKLTGEPLNAARRELGYLEKAGLLRSRREGNLKYYQVVKEFPLLPELKRVIYATIGLGDYLGSRLGESPKVELAFIFGSVAGNRERAGSDIDLLVVGEIEEEELHHLVSGVEEETGREINYVLMTRREFDERHRQDDAFLRRLDREEKLMLKGSPDVN